MPIPKWLVFDDIKGNLGRTWHFDEKDRCRLLGMVIGFPDEPRPGFVVYQKVDNLGEIMSPIGMTDQGVTILYRNHRGETTERHIAPFHIFYGSTECHPESQWLLQAFDFDKQAERTFSIRDILAWASRPTQPLGSPTPSTRDQRR